MGYFNPYLDPFKYHLTNKVPVYDKHAYNKYPNHNFVYDKLWVAKSQNLNSGKLEELKVKKIQLLILFLSSRGGDI